MLNSYFFYYLYYFVPLPQHVTLDNLKFKEKSKKIDTGYNESIKDRIGDRKTWQRACTLLIQWSCGNFSTSQMFTIDSTFQLSSKEGPLDFSQRVREANLRLVLRYKIQVKYSRCRLYLEIQGPSHPKYHLCNWNETEILKKKWLVL